MWRLILVLVCLSCMCPVVPDAVSQDRSELSEIKGVVTAVRGEKIAGAEVRFAQPGGAYTAVTDEDGSYSIRLAPGSYTVSASYVSMGFCRADRGSFGLRPTSELQLDFQLLNCGFDGPSAAYEKEELPELGPPGHRPLIHYGYRGRVMLNEYIGLIEQGVYVPAVMTFDVWSLRANSILYNRTLHTLEGRGDISWHDGREVRKGSYILIDFRNTNTIVVRDFR